MNTLANLMKITDEPATPQPFGGTRDQIAHVEIKSIVSVRNGQINDNILEADREVKFLCQICYAEELVIKSEGTKYTVRRGLIATDGDTWNRVALRPPGPPIAYIINGPLINGSHLSEHDQKLIRYAISEFVRNENGQ